jgi:DNA-binding TFAR19-related protein (PDSD5 family)
MSLEEIKRRKLEEMMQSQQEKAQEHAQIQQQVEQMETVVKQYLTAEAITRYGSIKAAHKEKAIQLLVLLFQTIQAGQIRQKLDDKTLKAFLEKITPQKREFKIKRV